MRRLPGDEVHVWLVPSSAAGSLSELLDAAERERAARFAFKHLRDTYVAAHGAVRLLLSRYLGTDGRGFVFEKIDGGKPVLPGSPVRFNLSRSGDLAAVALALALDVGVDVERRRILKQERGVAHRIMTASEFALYDKLIGPEREAFVLRVWSRKEALVKASGEGLRRELNSLACEPLRGSPWGVVDLDIPGHAGAVAARGKDWRPVVRWLDAGGQP